LREEHSGQLVAESTVRRYVQKRKRELDLTGHVVCVPQSYRWGQEAQVDWFEAVAKLGGEASKLYFFAMRFTAPIRTPRSKLCWIECFAHPCGERFSSN
jgi:hypothetical protein